MQHAPSARLAARPPDGKAAALAADEGRIVRKHQKAERHHPESEHRQEAEDAGVPIIRNVPLARALNYLGEEDDFIPEEYFDAVAEIIASAEKMRAARQPPAS